MADDDNLFQQVPLPSRVNPTDRVDNGGEDENNMDANDDDPLPESLGKENNSDVVSKSNEYPQIDSCLDNSALPDLSLLDEYQTKWDEELSAPLDQRYNNLVEEGGQHKEYEAREKMTNRMTVEVSHKTAKSQPNKSSHKRQTPNDYSQSSTKKVKPEPEVARRSAAKSKSQAPYNTDEFGQQTWHIGHDVALIALAAVGDLDNALLLLEKYVPYESVHFVAQVRKRNLAVSIQNALQWYNQNPWPQTEIIDLDPPFPVSQRAQSSSLPQAPTSQPANFVPNPPYRAISQTRAHDRKSSQPAPGPEAQYLSVPRSQTQGHNQKSSPLAPGQAQYLSAPQSQTRVHHQKTLPPAPAPQTQYSSIPGPHHRAHYQQSSPAAPLPQYPPLPQEMTYPSTHIPPPLPQETTYPSMQHNPPPLPQETTYPSMHNPRPYAQQVSQSRAHYQQSHPPAAAPQGQYTSVPQPQFAPRPQETTHPSMHNPRPYAQQVSQNRAHYPQSSLPAAGPQAQYPSVPQAQYSPRPQEMTYPSKHSPRPYLQQVAPPQAGFSAPHPYPVRSQISNQPFSPSNPHPINRPFNYNNPSFDPNEFNPNSR